MLVNTIIFFYLYEMHDRLNPGNQSRSFYKMIWTELWIGKPFLEKYRLEESREGKNSPLPKKPLYYGI